MLCVDSSRLCMSGLSLCDLCLCYSISGSQFSNKYLLTYLLTERRMKNIVWKLKNENEIDESHKSQLKPEYDVYLLNYTIEILKIQKPKLGFFETQFYSPAFCTSEIIIFCFYMLDVCCFSFLFSLYVSDSSVFTFCGVLVDVTLYCVAALLA